MRLALTLLAVCMLCVGCGGGDKIKTPTDVTKMDSSVVRGNSWGGPAPTTPAK